jgi:hypothetical protein
MGLSIRLDEHVATNFALRSFLLFALSAAALASTSSRIGGLNEALLDHLVDDTEIPRHLRGQEIVALQRVLDLLQRLAGVTDVNLVEALLQARISFACTMMSVAWPWNAPEGWRNMTRALGRAKRLPR